MLKLILGGQTPSTTSPSSKRPPTTCKLIRAPGPAERHNLLYLTRNFGEAGRARGKRLQPHTLSPHPSLVLLHQMLQQRRGSGRGGEIGLQPQAAPSPSCRRPRRLLAHLPPWRSATLLQHLLQQLHGLGRGINAFDLEYWAQPVTKLCLGTQLWLHRVFEVRRSESSSPRRLEFAV
jgi:hypothetical protein